MANQDISMIAHLMRRAGFGAPREELEVRAAKGYEATVDSCTPRSNAGHELLPKVGAQRTLEAVSWTPFIGRQSCFQ